MVTTRQVQVIAASVGAVAAAGVVGYAVWFDYKRRNDPEFRKKLSESSLCRVRSMQHKTDRRATTSAEKEHKKVHVSTAKEAKANKEKTTQVRIGLVIGVDVYAKEFFFPFCLSSCSSSKHTCSRSPPRRSQRLQMLASNTLWRTSPSVKVSLKLALLTRFPLRLRSTARFVSTRAPSS